MVGLQSCRQDMHDQPKYEAYEANEFFSDSLSSRPIVEGTVARGYLNEDPGLYRGVNASTSTDANAPKSFIANFPFAIDAHMLDRGQQRFNIYCAPCHARTGNGDGMVVRRGYKKPPTFHQERLRTMPVGYFFDVITNGFATMPSYADQIPVHDRWAIVAYLRALQLSQNGNVAEVPGNRRAQLDAVAPAAQGVTNQPTHTPTDPRTHSTADQPTGGSSSADAPTGGSSSGGAPTGNSNTQGGNGR